MIKDIPILSFILDLLKITFAGFLIHFALLVITRFIRYFLNRNNDKQYMNSLLLLFKAFIWIVFIVWSMTIIIALPLLENPILIFIFGVIFLLAVWLFGRDAVSGLILRLENSLYIDKEIDTGLGSGRIIKMGFRTLRLETESGIVTQVPYSKLISEKIISTAIRERFKSYETELEIARNISPDLISGIIKKAILYSPYSCVTRLPVIKFLNEPEGKSKVRIVIFTYNKDYFDKLVYQIMEKLALTIKTGQH